MKQDVKDFILPGESRKRNTENDGFFRSYQKRNEVGEKIRDGLFEKTVMDGDVMHFVLDDVEKRTGFLSDIYGCVGVFSLITRMNVKLTTAQKRDIKGTINWVIDYMDRYGFTMNPYLATDDELFDRSTPFYGAMTWSLSFLVNLCRTMSSGDDKKEKYFDLDEHKTNTVYKLISKIIAAFNDGVIKDADGKCTGWGFTKRSRQASLFYTYSILEAFSDFEDSVLGGMDVDLADSSISDDDELNGITAIGKRDERLIAYLKKDLDPMTWRNGADVSGLKFWRECCFEAAAHVWNKAEGIIKENFIGDNFFTEDNVVPEIKEADILKSSTSNALFNTLFVVFAGIYGYVNRVDQNGANENIDSVTDTMREALQNVQKTYESLSKKGLEYIVDSYSLLFQAGSNDMDFDGRKYSTKLNPENIFDSSLVPLLVKSNGMLASYIQKFPQKQMGQLFEKLFDNIAESDNAEKIVLSWDLNKYNVKNTERYLEAIADFYDYYDVYERGYVKTKAQIDAQVEKRVEEEKPRLERDANEKFKNEYEKKFEAWKEEETRKHEFESIFSAEITRIATEAFENRIILAFNNIIKARQENTSGNLGRFESELLKCMGALMLSVLDDHLIENENDELDVNRMHELAKKDIDIFIKEYSKRIAQSAKDNQPILGEIIKRNETK